MKRHGLLGFVSLSFALYAAAAVYAGPKATRPAPVSEKAATAEKPATPYAQLKTLAPAVRKPLTSIYEFEKYFQNAPVHPKQANPAAWGAMDKAAQTQADAKWKAALKEACDPAIFANKAFDWSILSLKSKARPTRDPRTKAFVLHTTFSTRIYRSRGGYITLEPTAAMAWKVSRFLGKPVRANGTIQSVRVEHRLVKGKLVPHLTLVTQDLFLTPATGPDAKRDAKTGIPLNSEYVPKPKEAGKSTVKNGRRFPGRRATYSRHRIGIGFSGYTASFFGSGGRAYNVIYLIDRSGSMLDTFGNVRDELYQSIGNLNQRQQFRVIFFLNKTPILIPAKGGFFKATRESKRTAMKKIGMIRSSGQTDPLPAIQEAFSGLEDKKKYLLFLLTDGEFPDNKKVLELLAEKNKDKRVQINTYLYSEGTPGQKAKKNMKEIADLYGGNYKYIKPE